MHECAEALNSGRLIFHLHPFLLLFLKKKKFSALCFNLVIFSSSGPQSVQVWLYKDLLPSRSGGLPGEAASGPAERRLRHHPEALPGVEPEEEVPAHEAGSHHPAGLRPWEEDNPVRGLDLLTCCSFFARASQATQAKAAHSIEGASPCLAASDNKAKMFHTV